MKYSIAILFSVFGSFCFGDSKIVVNHYSSESELNTKCEQELPEASFVRLRQCVLFKKEIELMEYRNFLALDRAKNQHLIDNIELVLIPQILKENESLLAE